MLPIDREHGAQAPEGAVTTDLTNLADWTGGEFYVSSSSSETVGAIGRIVDELRHQYLIAFEPAGNAGWHPLELRTRQKGLVVRTRSGYFAGKTASGRE